MKSPAEKNRDAANLSLLRLARTTNGGGRLFESAFMALPGIYALAVMCEADRT